MRIYTDETKAGDKWSLPDVEVFQLTAQEVAERDEEACWEFGKRAEFRLAHMSSRTREAMLSAMVQELCITGGWFWWSCLPGCLPDSEACGPFATADEACADAREQGGAL